MAGRASSAVLLVLLGSIAFGFFGLISAYAEKYDFSFLLFTSVSSAITFAIFGSYHLFSGRTVKTTISENTENPRVLFYNLLLTLFRLSTFLLIPAFSYFDNKMIGVGIYEAYPVLTVLLGYIFFPKEDDNTFQFLLFSPFILFGILLIFGGGDNNFEFIQNLQNNTRSWIGFALVATATLFAAANTILGPQVLIRLHEINNRTHLQNSISNNFFVYGLLALASALAYLFFGLSIDSLKHLLAIEFWLLALASAILVTVIPPVVSSIAGAISKNNSIFLIWLLSPIISLLLLYKFEFGELTSVMGLGVAIILIVNAVFNNYSKESLSFVAIQFVILIVSILIFFVDGNDDTYYETGSFLFVAFTVIAAFLQSRLQERVTQERELYIEVYKEICSLNGLQKREAIEDLKKLHRQTSFNDIHSHYLAVITKPYTKLLDLNPIHTYVLSRRSQLRYTEHYVLLMLAALLLLVLVFYRGDGFVYDMVALAGSATVVLTYFTILEQNFSRSMDILEVRETDESEVNPDKEPLIAIKNPGGRLGGAGMMSRVNTTILASSLALVAIVMYSKHL